MHWQHWPAFRVQTYEVYSESETTARGVPNLRQMGQVRPVALSCKSNVVVVACMACPVDARVCLGTRVLVATASTLRRAMPCRRATLGSDCAVALTVRRSRSVSQRIVSH